MTKLHSGTYYTTVVKNLRQIVKCGICGHKQKLQFHHIKPTKLNGVGRGSSSRAYDIVKHPDAYIPLCYFCHLRVTSETIDIRYNILNQLQWTNVWGHSEIIHVI